MGRRGGAGRDLARWRLAIVAVLGLLTRLLVAGYVGGTLWLAVTGGFEGWW